MRPKFFKQLPTFAARTYRGGALMRRFLKLGETEDSFYPEDWISSFVEAKNKNYVQNEGITRVLTDRGESLITNAVQLSDLGEGRQNSGVLIKLLDAGERLGIQVHPTKEYAKKHFNNAYGKTECWHILDTRDENACVYIGFKEHVTREYFKKLFLAQDIPGMLECMHRFAVSKGDVILVTAGTPHAIGAGCFLLEIQEPTDYTMRVEKTTLAGEKLTPMQIHYGVGEEAMLDCFSYDGASEETVRRRHFLEKRKCSHGVYDLVRYTDTPCFALKKVEGGMYRSRESSFVTVVVTEDGGALSCDGKIAQLCRGDKYFICADADFELSDATALICYPPTVE